MRITKPIRGLVAGAVNPFRPLQTWRSFSGLAMSPGCRGPSDGGSPSLADSFHLLLFAFYHNLAMIELNGL